MLDSTMREKDKLMKERNIHVFSGNWQRSSRNLRTMYFCSIYGLVFTDIVAGSVFSAKVKATKESGTI
jgi:hypothetical protein